ncbi:alanine racemase [Glycomyces paridis]|uniref:D-serine dehydratase-like domain-containing protein n=1 Tax=Glycomyces paridis TaxID=2126555 RepID=A0A4S8PRE6_9ACTN|nr:alanine racemase [Glycomyces paridis]THV32162.1 hypothetical protein E9998_01570 [Glycomyces paridis]
MLGHLDAQVIDFRCKGLPASAHGMTVAEWLGSGPHGSAPHDSGPFAADLPTPGLLLSSAAIDHNIRVMADWCAAKGLSLAPHGKAVMAPQLWRRQLAAGAVGVTVASRFQAGVAHAFGVPRVLVANEVADPLDVMRLASMAAGGTAVALFADAVAVVERYAAAFAASGGAKAPLDVLVELGIPGGRAGARSFAEAMRVAEVVSASPHLRLAGVAGYEGSVASGTDAASLDAIDAYLSDLAKLYAALDFQADRPVVTAGGSAYFDRVAAVLSPLAPEAEVVLRSGAYLTHDHGFYARMTPAARGGDGPTFKPASEGRARVLSRPEPGTVVLDGGRRDFPFDQDLPVPLGFGATGAQISDQHLTLTGVTEDLAVGDVVRLGLSHPCTTFDKWRQIPMADPATGRVVEVVWTFF